MARGLIAAVVLALVTMAGCGDDSGGPGPAIDAAQDGAGGAGDGAAAIDAPPCQGNACVCPAAMESHCGDPCSAPESGCLCACGGGGDFTACGCQGGFFECANPC